MSELQRRLVHLSGASLPLLYALGLLPWRYLQGLLVLGSSAAAVLEVLRLFAGLDWAIYDRLTREYERDNPAAYALYMFSTTAVALAFEPYVAVPGMLMLAVGDPISGVLGRNDVGTTKRLEALAVMFGVCFLLALPFLIAPAAGTTLAGGVLSAAVGAAAATLADGVKPVIAGYVVDDNLSIPPAACVGIALVLQLT